MPFLRAVLLSLPLAGVLMSGAMGAAAAPPQATATPSSTSAGDDPYLWLEDLHGPRVMGWVHAENAKTLGVLEKDPAFKALYADALALAQTKDRIPYPDFLNGRIFNFWQDAQHVRGLWRATTPAGYRSADPEWKTVLDFDALAAREKANWVFKGDECEEPAETRCVLELSDGGEDAVTAREFDVATGAFVPGGFDLPRGKQRVAWEDDDTLLVSREWAPGDLTTSGYPFIVKRVKRGQPLDQAREIYRGSAQDGGYGVTPETLVDGEGHRALLIERPLSTFEAERYLVTPRGVEKLDLPLKARVEALVAGQLIVALDQDWTPHGGAPLAAGSAAQGKLAQGCVVAIDLAQATAHPAALAATVIYAPGPRETFLSATASRDALLLNTMDNVRGRLLLLHPDGQGHWARQTLALPDNASISVVSADRRGDAAYVAVSGFLQPSSLMLVDTRDGSLTPVRTLPAQFDASRDVVAQFEATSTDGTKVPYFVVHPKGMALNGANPTILYAYGGFQASMRPSYNPTLGKLWLEKGGVYVLANIRGGGEFGPAWHDAGLTIHRQRVYDDFAAVARDLIARKITTPRHLGIEGGSNGGLLMGVEMTQHPELWHAVDIQVPLLDMLRFEKIQAGASWVGEYGSVSVPEERAFLASISPYANLKRGVRYPEALIWTTTKDDRVGPQHARKFAARLKEYGIPYFFYEVTEGGHGSGANLRERAHTNALEMTYFTRKLMR